MPIGIGAATLIAGLAGSGAAVGTGIYGAKKQAKLAKEAAQLQTQQATSAAESQERSNREALEYTKQKDEQARIDAQNAERANYAQWLAREQRLSYLGELAGLPARDIPSLPDYLQPGGARPGGMPPAASTGASGAGGEIPATPADLQTAIAQANQLAYGGRNKHDDPNYWAAMWAKDPSYTWKRLLGWQAGGADVATAGPYAGAGGSRGPNLGTNMPGSPYAMNLGGYLGSMGDLTAPNLVYTPPLSQAPPVYRPYSM